MGAAEEVLTLFENVAKHLDNGNHDTSVVAAVVHLNAGLKIHGLHLENFYKDRLDKFQVKLMSSVLAVLHFVAGVSQARTNKYSGLNTPAQNRIFMRPL